MLRKTSGKALGHAHPSQQVAASPAPTVFLATMPSPAELLAYRENDWIQLPQRLGKPTAEHREKLLASTDQLPEPQRVQMLCILLLQWADSDPAAAAAWSIDHPGLAQCFVDVVNIWSIRDGLALAKWMDKRRLASKDDLRLWGLSGHVDTALGENDPIALAAYIEMKSHRGNYWTKPPKSAIQNPADMYRMMQAVAGQVGYQGEGEALTKKVTERSSESYLPGKQGWNELFEETVIALHRHNDAECRAWLGSFPANAQEVALHLIAQEDAPPNQASGNDPTPTRPAVVALELDHIPSPQEHPGAYAEWAQWWNSNPQSAETFLNACGWPEEMKFRARAKAYALPPPREP